MDAPTLGCYLIRDQEGQTPRTLDLLQAWGPPLRPPVPAQIAGMLIRIANWLDPGRHSMFSLDKFNLVEMLSAFPPRTNINVIRIDQDYAARIVHLAGRFPWHRHPDGEEGWFVYQGAVLMDTGSGAIELSAGEGAVIPRGLEHSPVAQREGTTAIIFYRMNLGMELRPGEKAPEDFRIIERPRERDAQTSCQDALLAPPRGSSSHP